MHSEEGRRVHAHMKSSGFKPGVVISNRLLDMYVKCECLSDAQKLFDVMNEKDLCSYNSMISGYAKVGFLEQARKLFDEMRDRDNFSWTAIISGYVRYDKPLEALELYRNKVQRVQTWKDALKQTANLSGLDSRVIKPESVLINNIVDDVLKKLKNMSPAILKNYGAAVYSHFII
ncbi:hypothetical protein LWI28_008503 [Acer negundo]|uniref:TIR domain-containing protein n=1 Tax=Acer negundo TaxID=4023 RepID=A0AAD5NIK3_ACENE|nr:hypothetical protein LWI28_008503 [Acer negundo]